MRCAQNLLENCVSVMPSLGEMMRRDVYAGKATNNLPNKSDIVQTRQHFQFSDVSDSDDDSEASFDLSLPQSKYNDGGVRFCALFIDTAKEGNSGVVALQSAVDEVRANCDFFRNPQSHWRTPTPNLHITLYFCGSLKSPRPVEPSVEQSEIEMAKHITEACSPVILRLHKFLWTKEGTFLCVWHVLPESGNIDRLRIDFDSAFTSKSKVLHTLPPPSIQPKIIIHTTLIRLLIMPTVEQMAALRRSATMATRIWRGKTLTFLNACYIQEENCYEGSGIRINLPFASENTSYITLLYRIITRSSSARRCALWSTLFSAGFFVLLFNIIIKLAPDVLKIKIQINEYIKKLFMKIVNNAMFNINYINNHYLLKV
eukprot:GHVL01032679.1.p1 GENE.GHVL01032679.1~~GHVL01032679.1.p1  ORF type:complete len:372 (-),score=76.49 GHVL01032679.1:21-1136(-)